MRVRRRSSIRKLSGAFVDQHFEDPFWSRARTDLHGLRRVRLHLPDLPLLRHRRCRAFGGQRALPDVGLVPVPHVHRACFRPQSARRPAQPAAPAHSPQILHLPREIRRDSLHRMRQLHAQLPRGYRGAELLPRKSTMDNANANANVYKPDLMEVDRRFASRRPT